MIERLKLIFKDWIPADMGGWSNDGSDNEEISEAITSIKLRALRRHVNKFTGTPENPAQKFSLTSDFSVATGFLSGVDTGRYDIVNNPYYARLENVLAAKGLKVSEIKQTPIHWSHIDPVTTKVEFRLAPLNEINRAQECQSTDQNQTYAITPATTEGECWRNSLRLG